MSSRAESLATAFERVNAALVAAIEGCSDAEWGTISDSEKWAIGVVAHHVAEDHSLLTGWVQIVAAGTDVPAMPPGFVDQYNAQQAQKNAGCTRPATIELLRANMQEAAVLIRRLTDEQLDTRSSVLGRAGLSTEDVIQHILIGHVQQHLASIRATLQTPRAEARPPTLSENAALV